MPPPSQPIEPSSASAAAKEATEAGNYFVANYPPFSFWKPEHVGKVAEVLESPSPGGVPLGVYFHIPFCRKRCHFCYFRVYTDKNAKEIRGYLDAGIRELETYAAKPYLAGRKPQFVYFGGGTPSYLSVDQLKSLTSRMKAIMPWDEAEEVAFECEPGTITRDKLEAIRNIGVTRLSIGVENFDDHILEVNGRAHRSKEIFNCCRWARELGFPQINIDLIAGMLEETEDNWKRCVEKAVEIAPDYVTVYQMEIPFNTGIYQQMQASGGLTAPVADWPTKRRWADYAFREFEKAGYATTSTCTAVRDPAHTKFLYRDSLWTGADLLSLGVASFGHFGGVHYQNQANFDPYLAELESGSLPVFRAYSTNEEERLVREFILQMKLGRVRVSYFQEKFGVDVREKFAGALKSVNEDRFLVVGNDDEIRLNREGLLQVDRLLHAFFLPQHRNARYT